MNHSQQESNTIDNLPCNTNVYKKKEKKVPISSCFLKIVTWVFLFISVGIMIGASGLDTYNNTPSSSIRNILIISSIFAFISLIMSIYINTTSYSVSECFGSSTGLLQRDNLYS